MWESRQQKCFCVFLCYCFFFNDTATTEIYTLPYTTLFRSVNVVVWQRLWERRRSIILNASLIAVDGVMESDGEVYHLIARQVHDFGELVKGLKTRSRDFC